MTATVSTYPPSHRQHSATGSSRPRMVPSVLVHDRCVTPRGREPGARTRRPMTGRGLMADSLIVGRRLTPCDCSPGASFGTNSWHTWRLGVSILSGHHHGQSVSDTTDGAGRWQSSDSRPRRDTGSLLKSARSASPRRGHGDAPRRSGGGAAWAASRRRDTAPVSSHHGQNVSHVV
jgi:hypothetical protein